MALSALLLGLLLAVAGPSPGATPPPAGRHLRPDGHVSLAWLYGGSSADYRAQIDRAAGLSVVSPTWWYLDADDPGALELATDDALTAYAHDRGIAVWPLLGNHIDPDLTDQVLRDPALFQRLVDGVVAEVRRSGVDGVNVDFENLHDRTAVLLTDLVAALDTALPDLVVSVDVTAMTDTWVLGNWSTAFDRAGLGEVADYVMLMSYDQHNSLRRDGPVAGLDWVAESTRFLLRTVPAHKVVLGLPFYSRDWAEDPAARDGIDLDATLGMAAMSQRMAERSTSVAYDDAAGQDLHTYVDAQGRPHRVWLEDVASIQRKTELVATHGLAGVAAWRAGFEQPEVWTAIDAQLAAMPAPTASSSAGGGTGGQAVTGPAGPADPTGPEAAGSPLAVVPPSDPPTAVPTGAPTTGAAPSPTATDVAVGGADVDGPTAPAASTRSRSGWVLAAAGLLALAAAGTAVAVRRR